MILYRPVGTKELELIEKSHYREFPPRLAEPLILYTVLNSQKDTIGNNLKNYITDMY